MAEFVIFRQTHEGANANCYKCKFDHRPNTEKP